MTLPLPKVKLQPVSDKDRYNPKNFASTYNALGELQETDVKTKEGLETYHKVVGDEEFYKARTPGQLEGFREDIVSGGLEILASHAKKHAKDLTAELGDNAPLFALNHAPRKVKMQDNEPYNVVVETVDGMYNVLESIKQQYTDCVDYYYNKDIVGYTSRYYEGPGPKYISEQQRGYIFNYDGQSNRANTCVLVEGQFDASASVAVPT
jgi:hypothetical protein